jgi:hypothetical protein
VSADSVPALQVYSSPFTGESGEAGSSFGAPFACVGGARLGCAKPHVFLGASFYSVFKMLLVLVRMLMNSEDMEHVPVNCVQFQAGRASAQVLRGDRSPLEGNVVHLDMLVFDMLLY